jgi:hypothetical protein
LAVHDCSSFWLGALSAYELVEVNKVKQKRF